MIVQLLHGGSWAEALSDLAVTEDVHVARETIDAMHPPLWYGGEPGDGIDYDGADDVRRDITGVIATPVLGERADLEACRETVGDMVSADDYGTAALDTLAARISRPMFALALEPLRWTLALYPQWHAQEARPEAAPLLRAQALALQSCGYSTWTGILVDNRRRGSRPEDRRRAALAASRVLPVGNPTSALLHVDTADQLGAPWLLLRQLVAVNA